MATPSVSVIIPIYNTAPFVERCLRSLFEQTLDSIEYILIDDCTPDNAMEIASRVIDEYPNRKPHVRIVNHTENKGLAYTRAEGLRQARGEYVIHCDSDDWVDRDFYLRLYETAEVGKADIVTGNYILEKPDVKYNCALPLWNNWHEFINHPKWEFLAIWCHLIRREFLIENKLNFYPDVDYSEDYGLLFRCYYYSNKNLVYSGHAYYHYSKLNESSMTVKQLSIKNLDNKARCLSYLADFVDTHGGNSKDNVILNEEKRAVKEGYLLCSPPDFVKWKHAFPEVTPIVIKDKKLSLPYRISWSLGQYIHPIFLKRYINRANKPQIK